MKENFEGECCRLAKLKKILALILWVIVPGLLCPTKFDIGRVFKTVEKHIGMYKVYTSQLKHFFATMHNSQMHAGRLVEYCTKTCSKWHCMTSNLRPQHLIDNCASLVHSNSVLTNRVISGSW